MVILATNRAINEDQKVFGDNFNVRGRAFPIFHFCNKLANTINQNVFIVDSRKASDTRNNLYAAGARTAWCV